MSSWPDQALPTGQGSGAGLMVPPSGYVFAAPPAPAPEPRRPGRPLKRTAEYFAAVLETHRIIEAWFLSEFGFSASSDRELYEQHHRHECAAQQRRLNEADFRRWLKTRRNELAEARRQHRTMAGAAETPPME